MKKMKAKKVAKKAPTPPPLPPPAQSQALGRIATPPVLPSIEPSNQGIKLEHQDQRQNFRVESPRQQLQQELVSLERIQSQPSLNHKNILPTISPTNVADVPFITTPPQQQLQTMNATTEDRGQSERIPRKTKQKTAAFPSKEPNFQDTEDKRPVFPFIEADLTTNHLQFKGLSEATEAKRPDNTVQLIQPAPMKKSKKSARISSFSFDEAADGKHDVYTKYVKPKVQDVIAVPESQGTALTDEHPLLPFTNQDLIQARTRLSKQSWKKRVTLYRQQLFDALGVATHYPLERLQDVLTTDVVVTEMKLTGVDQLTDLFFHIMVSFYNPSTFQYMQKLSLEGCFHLTDSGVKWLSFILSSLDEINLTGCKKLTEQSLSYLIQNCNFITSINMSGTDVGVVWVSDTQNIEVVSMKLDGCPLVSPTRNTLQGKTLEQCMTDLKLKPMKHMYKVVVVTNDKVDLSIFDSLLRQKVPENQRAPVVIHQNWKHSKLNDITLNLVECPQHIIDIFTSSRAIYLLPYDADDDDSSIQKLVDTILHIVAKAPGAVFLLVGVTKGGSPRIDQATFINNIATAIKKLKEALTSELDTLHTELSGVGFRMQQVCGRAALLSDTLSALLDTGSHLKYATLDARNLEGMDEVLYQLKECTDKLYESSPMYAHLAEEFWSFSGSLKPMPGMHSMVDMWTQHKADKLFGSTFGPYRKAVELMHMMGQLVFIPEAENGVVITDMTWMAQVLNSILSLPAPSPGDDEDGVWPGAVPLWTTASMQTAISQHFGSDLLKNAKDMQTLGEVMRLSIVPSLYSHLKPQPIVPMSNFWSKESAETEYTEHCTYDFLHVLPASVMSHIIYIASANRQPVLAWRQGALFQEGHVDVLVQIIDQKKVKISARSCRGVEEDSYGARLPTNQYISSTLNLYMSMMEYVIHRFNFYFNFKLEIKGDNKVDEKYQHPKGKGIVPFHQMSWKMDDKKNGRVQGLCNDCGISDVTCAHLHHINKTLEPSVSKVIFKVINYVGRYNDQRKGSVIQMESEITKLIVNLPLTPTEFPYFEVTLVDSLELSIGVRATNGAHVMLDVGPGTLSDSRKVVSEPKGKNSKTAPQKVTKKTIIVAEMTKLQIGDTVRVQIRFESQSECVVQWMRGQEVICNTSLPMDQYLPVIVNSKAVKFVLDVHQAQVLTEDLVSLRMKNGKVKWDADTGSCKSSPFRPSVAEHFIKNLPYAKERGDVSLGAVVKHFVDLDERTPLLCVLPAGLTKENLLFPTRQAVHSSKQEVHIVCTVKDSVHLLDGRGYVFQQEDPGVIQKAVKSKTKTSQHPAPRADLSLDSLMLDHGQLLACVSLVMLQQKEFAPDCLETLVSNGKEMSRKQVQAGLRRFLQLRLVTLSAMVNMINNREYWQLGEDEETISLPTATRQTLTKIFNSAWIKMNSSLSGTDRQKLGTDISSQGFICPAHLAAKDSEATFAEFPMDHFTSHFHLISFLNISNKNLQTLPSDFFQKFLCLKHLNLAHNQLSAIPEGMKELGQLQHLDISHNQLSQLPEDFEKCAMQLVYLDISNNRFVNIPKPVYMSENLVTLKADHILLTEIAEDIGKLEKLVHLSLAGHMITSFPTAMAKLTKLKDLNLAGIKWLEGGDSTKSLVSRQAFQEFINKHPATQALDSKECDRLFSESDEGQQGTLDFRGIQRLNAELYKRFPRLGKDLKDADEEPLGGCPSFLFSLTALESLNLSYQGLRKVPDKTSELRSLTAMDVSNNPQLESVAGDLGTLPLQALHLRGCPSLKTPPREIVVRGFQAVYGYLRRLHMGSVECKRTKLMLVGLGGAGKTSLVHALTDGHLVQSGSKSEEITDGIDITSWTVQAGEDEVTFSVWDFAGQTVYYNTHQFFMSNRAVYLLLWNIRLGYEHAGLDFWLSSIACHAPKAPILIVGSHADQVEKFSLPSEELQKRFPQICGFHNVSSFSGMGIKELSDNLTRVALQEKYMGERIPEAWMNFEMRILGERSKQLNLLPWKTVENFAAESGIVDHMEVNQAVGFLHDLGSVQHFNNHFLKSKVVINPQWIVDVMACVVSVHNNAVQDGKLYHKDVGVIWKDYDQSLWSWLLRLTEEFDLTFPLPEEKASLVPCLLPDKEPEYTWPDVSGLIGIRENKMLYKFDYLPAGLFNRAQVRLYQFSDNSVIWKSGSLLRKNGHLALLTQQRNSRVLVKVQGPRPENILFMIHEVFEGLVTESFHGVTYDFMIPCVDCLKVGTYDPCMFAASKIRRATELKAPFLQCNKYFHTLSITELHAMMPPDNSSDFDVHLGRGIHDLQEMRETLSTDVFMLYSPANVPTAAQENKLVHPRQIKEDLEKAGFKVWYSHDPSQLRLDQVAITMKDAKLLLVCISNEFVADQHLSDIFHYAQESLQKKVQLIVLGSGMEWQQTSLGLMVASEVFVSMVKKDRYLNKFKELIDGIQKKTDTNILKQDTQQSYECFISYCWANSKQAVDKGSRALPGSLGWGDPRQVKDFLTEKGIKCWMDIERVGQGGLFEDIAEGLKHAKAIVVCVSDEYVQSRNCRMEFRFASTQLKLPMVMAIVGTGYMWEISEVGMLGLGCPKVNFQLESPTAYDKILQEVQKLLAKWEAENKGAKHLPENRTPSPQENTQQAFQELLELAQRKFLRQLTSYADALDQDPYPRLFLVDYASAADLHHSGSQATTEAKAAEEQGEGDKAEAPPGENTEKEQQLCVRILCEHEGGWHTAAPGLVVPPMGKTETDALLSKHAQYLARILAIIKHTQINPEILKSPEGVTLVRHLEEKCTPDAEFQSQYSAVCRATMALDNNKSMGNLARCHLASGKVIWLCSEHQKEEGVAVLSDEVSPLAPQPDQREEDNIMAQRIAGSKPPLKKRLTRQATQTLLSTSTTPDGDLDFQRQACQIM